MKSTTCVAFFPNTGLPLWLYDTALLEMNDSATVIAMNCSEGQETSYGFLRLVPKEGEKHSGMALYVPPSAIAWMAQAERAQVVGFVRQA